MEFTYQSLVHPTISLISWHKEEKCIITKWMQTASDKILILLPFIIFRTDSQAHLHFKHDNFLQSELHTRGCWKLDIRHTFYDKKLNTENIVVCTGFT